MTYLEMRRARAFQQRKGIKSSYRLTPIFILITLVLTPIIASQYINAVQDLHQQIVMSTNK